MNHTISARARTRLAKDTLTLFFICGVYSSVVTRFLRFPSPIEDSYIIFRYAAHFARGDGLTWNEGLARDQGMTGVLWPIMLGYARRYLALSLPALAGVMGVILGCLCLSFLYLALRRALTEEHSAFAALGTLALALTPVFDRHSGSGMETMLTCFDFSLVVFAASAISTTRVRLAAVISALLTAATFLIRPDATIFPIIALNTLLVVYNKERRWQWVGATVLGSLFLVGVENVLLGKYFETSLPLPVYIKVSFVQASNSSLSQILSMLPWIASYQLAMLSICTVWLAFISLALLQKQVVYAAASKSILVAAVVFYLYLFTVRPLGNFNVRYQSPLLIPIIYLGTLGLASIVSLIDTSDEWSGAAKLTLFLCTICYSIGSIYSVKADVKTSVADHQQYKALAVAVSKDKDAILISTEAGVLAYYSDARFFDLFGLNSTFVAMHHKDVNYGSELESYLKNQFGIPDIYVRRPGGIDAYADLCNYPTILSHYDYLGKFPEGETDAEVYVLRNGAKTASIKLALPLTVQRVGEGCNDIAK